MKDQNIPGSQRPSSPNQVCRFCKAEIDPSYDRPDATFCKKAECLKKAKLEYAHEHIEDIMIRAQFPIHFRKITTDRDLSKYRDLNRGLYIHGTVGSGKSIFACSLGRQLLLGGRSVRFFSTIALILQLYDMWRRPDEQIKKFMDEAILKPEVIILDDLGSEKVTDYVRTTFFYLINEIEMREQMVIITSNFSLDDLDKHLGCRIASRIAGMCDVLRFAGKDRRIHNEQL